MSDVVVLAYYDRVRTRVERKPLMLMLFFLDSKKNPANFWNQEQIYFGMAE